MVKANQHLYLLFQSWSLATNMHKQFGVYFECQRSRLIYKINPFSLYRGLKRGPSDPEADDIPMCQHASNRSCTFKMVSYKFLF